MQAYRTDWTLQGKERWDELSVALTYLPSQV